MLPQTLEQNPCIWDSAHSNAYRLLPTLGSWQRAGPGTGAWKTVVSQLEYITVSCKPLVSCKLVAKAVLGFGTAGR